MAGAKATQPSEENEAGGLNSSKQQEWILARQGINLLINNNHSEAETLFLQYPNSLVMYAGYSFAVFMDALMSFEDEKLSKAILVLKEVEKRCTTQNGWLKSLSQKVFGATLSSTQTLAEQLETQIILADSQVCLAILTFLQQDLSGYFKGGWVLRKGWKVYQKTYKDIMTLYKENIGELLLPDPIITPVSPPSATFGPTDSEEDIGLSSSLEDWDIPESRTNGYSRSANTNFSRSLTFSSRNADNDRMDLDKSEGRINNSQRPKSLGLKKSISVTESLSARAATGSTRFHFGSLTNTLSLTALTSSLKDILPGQSHHHHRHQHSESPAIDKKTIVRLMGAISFGYGLFQLGVSLLPLSLTRLISLLGFAANRQNGIACLMYARSGVDMRAPLASLALLWYHTIVRPFYAIDGVNVQAGVEAAMGLIQESQKEFADSALFLFFAGRTGRLRSDIPSALESFQKANDNANHREIKMLCLHEIGWCHLIELDYQNGKTTFTYLKQASRWSRSFYCYLAAICIGAQNDFSNYHIFDELIVAGGGTRSGQLDEFLSRRLYCIPKSGEAAKQYSTYYFKLLVFEMLYLWNALASCSDKNLDDIISDCSHANCRPSEPRCGLASLILGCCYSIKGDFIRAAASFRKCLDERKNEAPNAEDAHISAFAQFELGNILIQKDEGKEEGKLLLQQISRYDHYDFEARLSVRIHSILRHLD